MPAIRLAADDFEVFRTEQLTRTSTVLLVDMSRSMLLRGCFVAAKKVAVALDTLIRTQYPHDDLHVIGFAYYARELRPEALAELTWHGYEYGTNLQHGLMLARRLLARHHGGDRQIVVITDGEPTAHFENGQVEFSYPPTRRTIQETLREVQRCTRDGITINTFMLERSRALAEFVALDDPAQPRPGVLRDAGAAGRVRPRRLRVATIEGGGMTDERRRGATFRTTILGEAHRPRPGSRCRSRRVAALGTSKKPAVQVSLNGYTYRSTVATVDGRYMVGVSSEHRAASGLEGRRRGRRRACPRHRASDRRAAADFAAALDAEPAARATFDKLSNSNKGYHVSLDHRRQVGGDAAAPDREGRRDAARGATTLAGGPRSRSRRPCASGSSGRSACIATCSRPSAAEALTSRLGEPALEHHRRTAVVRRGCAREL